MNQPTKVVVAMSGGVDSSVAAALMVEQGYEVIGVMMRLWSESGRETYNRCCTPEAMTRARRVAAQLEIPFYAIDAQKTFHDIVVNYFIDGYISGNTPNPCLVCNRHIRWEFLLNHALAMGAEYMVTGHYARLQNDYDNPIKILQAIDKTKDQSYVLSVLRQDQLQHALFPLGEYTKVQVRELARKFNLPVAEIRDSQDLCFLAGTDYASFLRRNAPEVEIPGQIVNLKGVILGQHSGLAFYTIGQRKGLGISSQAPLYVIDKEMESNTLVVGEQDELGVSELFTDEINWVSGYPPESAFSAHVKIRYTSEIYPASISLHEDGGAHIVFETPLRDITPGQAAVIYSGEEVLGSGLIRSSQSLNENQFVQLISLESIK